MRTRLLSIAGVAFTASVAVALAIAAETPSTEQVVPRRALAARVAIRDFDAARDGTVSGTLRNVSTEPVRDVQLVIDRTWLWKKEFHPGKDDPGRAEFHTIEDTIPPGGQVYFTYRPSTPLPQRSDGHFDTSVGVISLVTIEG